MGLYQTPAGVTIRMGDKAALAVGYRLIEPDAAAPTPDAAEATSAEPKGNASKAEWAAYADSLGVEYPEDAKRDDIKAAIEEAGTRDPEGDGEAKSDPDAPATEAAASEGSIW